MGYTLCVVGCGTMGIAIISGVISSLESSRSQLAHSSQNAPLQKLEAQSTSVLTPTIRSQEEDLQASDPAIPTRFLACVSRESSAKKLQGVFGSLGEIGATVEVYHSNNVEAVRQADVILLCCKPYLASLILSEPGMREALDKKLLISILAGVTSAQLKELVTEDTKVVRAMPNTPCKIREGMTVITPLPPDANLDRKIIHTIFSSIGRHRFLEERLFDAGTAVCGSGPAFACMFLEAMADGGVMMGLPRASAVEFAAQTLQGAARMVLQDGAHPAQTKDNVTTPGGCTIAGLLSLEDGRFRSTVARAVQAATERASALGQPAKKP